MPPAESVRLAQDNLLTLDVWNRRSTICHQTSSGPSSPLPAYRLLVGPEVKPDVPASLLVTASVSMQGRQHSTAETITASSSSAAFIHSQQIVRRSTSRIPEHMEQ
jgi:hypothetical protein